MDAASLLISVSEITTHLQQSVRGQHTQTAALLSPILMQLELLEQNIQSVQQWLYFSDPADTANMMACFQNVFASINTSIGRLRRDLATVAQSDGGGTTFQARLKEARQCVALVQFVLRVCQLPVGAESERELGELREACSIFRNSHAYRAVGGELRQRTSLRQSINKTEVSQDFARFLDNFSREEQILQDVSPETTPVPLSPVETLSSPWDNTLDQTDLESLRERAIVQPDAESWQCAAASRPVPRHRAVTDSLPSLSLHERARENSTSSLPTITTSPRGPDSSHRSSSTRLSRMQILRKPVSRSGSLSIPIESPSQVKALRQSRDMQAQEAFPSPPPSRRSMLRASISTNELFEKATNSLSDLAEDMRIVEPDEPIESPPPYVRRESPPVLTADADSRDAQIPHSSFQETHNIVQCVRDNRTDLLRTTLAQGTGIDEADPVTRRTALMEAARLRRAGIAQMLIRAGSRLHLKDIDGNTALHFATMQGDVDSCEALLRAGAQLEEYNRFGDTPLMLAARSGHTDMTECLLDGWTLHNGTGVALTKGFLEASRSGNVSTAEAFLAKGVKPKKIEASWKPVAYAAQSGSLPMLDFMLAQKYPLKEKSPDGWTALHFAAHHGQTAMVEKLLALKLSWKAQTKKTEETALHLSALAGHKTTSMALILHKDANITIKDADGMQALHHAVRNGDNEMSTVLLNKGAKIDDANKYGWKPIHIAVAYGHLPLVAEFITRGADTEEKLKIPDVKPIRKTNEAARKGYWAEIRWPHPGARPLHLALEFSQDEVASILIAGGVKIDQDDSKGWYPLHYAAFNCRVQLLELLLARGASPHATTAEGNTALSLGFRGPGLAATEEDKERVWSSLQGAMNARRKKKSEQFSSLINIGPTHKSRDAASRNKTWHTAELAAALYLNESVEEGDGDVDSQLTPSSSSMYKGEEGPDG